MKHRSAAAIVQYLASDMSGKAGGQLRLIMTEAIEGSAFIALLMMVGATLARSISARAAFGW
jgi:hypothetical protein